MKKKARRGGIIKKPMPKSIRRKCISKRGIDDSKYII